MSYKNKKSPMLFYINRIDPFCYRILMVLAEKDIKVNLIDINESDNLEKLRKINPFCSVPTLINKDLIIYNDEIIFEYLEERFPYPPLMSILPIERAFIRMAFQAINNNWMPILIQAISKKNISKKKYSILALNKLILNLTPTLNKQPYLIGKEFSIIDCSMAVIFFNMIKLKIKIPNNSIALIKYIKRLFERDSFKKILRYNKKLNLCLK